MKTQVFEIGTTSIVWDAENKKGQINALKKFKELGAKLFNNEKHFKNDALQICVWGGFTMGYEQVRNYFEN